MTVLATAEDQALNMGVGMVAPTRLLADIFDREEVAGERCTAEARCGRALRTSGLSAQAHGLDEKVGPATSATPPQGRLGAKVAS